MYHFAKKTSNASQFPTQPQCITFVSLASGYHGMPPSTSLNDLSPNRYLYPTRHAFHASTPSSPSLPGPASLKPDKFFPYKHWPQHLDNPAKLLQQCSAQDHAGCTQIIRSSFTLNVYKEGISKSHNRFIWVCIQAYNSHHNPIIRPDDVWPTILT